MPLIFVVFDTAEWARTYNLVTPSGTLEESFKDPEECWDYLNKHYKQIGELTWFN